MYRFYIGNGRIEENYAILIGKDVNHIKNVLRMKCGERLLVCTTDGTQYCCRILEFQATQVITQIESQEQSFVELSIPITLFQGIPKREKMEFVIQKAVELGVFEIVPVMTKRVVVKLEDVKREEKKLTRWQAIAESAAKQSGREKIPKIHPVMNWNEALNYSKGLDMTMIPYELEKDKGMRDTKEWIQKACTKNSVGIFIGPEGGFEVDEILMAKAVNIVPISLGRRILRTETAAITALSILMYELECHIENS